jgi:predicted helicase
MSEKKLAKIFYADLWGLREEKYKYLFENDVRTTKWQEIKPASPYYFFVPKDFALQAEYEKFWKVTEIFKEWASGVSTRRDHFMVGFLKNEIIQRLRVFRGQLSDDLVKVSLKLEDSKYWKVFEARQKVKNVKFEDKLMEYGFKIFDKRWIFYFPDIIERGDSRLNLMKHMLKPNLALITTRKIPATQPFDAFVCCLIGDVHFVSDRSYFFPLYLYPDEPVGAIHELPLQQLPLRNKSQPYRVSNFTPKFLQAFSAKIGIPVGAGLVPAQMQRATTRVAPTPEEIFYYIYGVLYSPTYRKRYEEFLKIDFPRVPLPQNNQVFEKLSNLGKELVELHLLKHPSLDETEIGFPISGANNVKKVIYDEDNKRTFINKEQYFDGISKVVWEYRIGAYQVMEKYLKDRKGRKLSLDEINHYMKVAKAIRLTIELQANIDIIFKNSQGC